MEASAQALKYTKERLAQAGDIVIILTILPSRIVSLYRLVLSCTCLLLTPLRQMDPSGAFMGISAGIVAPSEWYFEEEQKRFDKIRQVALDKLYESAKGFKDGVELHVRLA